jgi:hypothetical protein
MAERSPRPLLRLAAELRSELEYIDRTVSDAQPLLLSVPGERITLYASAALLDTFYTRVEKAFRRIAAELGGLPEGHGWQRALLENMALDIPEVRPAVLSVPTVKALSRFLSFRHRFRNLYLVELEPAPLATLVQELAPSWSSARAEIENFLGFLGRLADELD